MPLLDLQKVDSMGHIAARSKPRLGYRISDGDPRGVSFRKSNVRCMTWLIWQLMWIVARTRHGVIRDYYTASCAAMHCRELLNIRQFTVLALGAKDPQWAIEEHALVTDPDGGFRVGKGLLEDQLTPQASYNLPKLKLDPRCIESKSFLHMCSTSSWSTCPSMSPWTWPRSPAVSRSSGSSTA